MRMLLLAATALATTVTFLVPGAASAFDWNGPYVGGVAGVVASKGDVEFEYGVDATGPDGIDLRGMGAMAGVTVGYNYVLGNFVIGVEGDASFSTLKHTTTYSAGPIYASVEEQLKSLVTLRARFGVPYGSDTLFYSTLGIAGGEASASSYISDTGKGGPAASSSGFVGGVVGGVGVEHAISDKVTIKGEVLGYALGSQSAVGDTGKGSFEATHHPAGVMFRTGINFHF